MYSKTIEQILYSKGSYEFKDGKLYMSYDSPAGHFRRNQGKYLVGGGTLIGAGIGYGLSKKSAIKKAQKKGLKEGSDEYKKFIRNHRIKRGVIGAAIGATGGVGATLAKHLYDVNHHSKKKREVKPGDLIKITHGKGIQVGQHYGIYDGRGGFLNFQGFEKGSGEISRIPIDKLGSHYSDARYKFEPNPTNKSMSDIFKNIRNTRKKYEGKYNVYDNNCEHWAREVSSGKRFSTQADGIPGFIGKNFIGDI